MLDALLSIFTGGATGGIVGAGAAYMTKKLELKSLELAQNHEVIMGEQSIQELQLEQSHQLLVVDKEIDLAETEGEIATDLKETEGWIETLKSQSKPSGNSKVDAIRSLMRPVITTYFLVVSSYLTYNIATLVGGLKVMPIAELVTMYTMIITQVFFLTNMTVSWWFGSRGGKK